MDYCQKSVSSIHGDQIGEVHDVPMEVIIRCVVNVYFWQF